MGHIQIVQWVSRCDPLSTLLAFTYSRTLVHIASYLSSNKIMLACMADLLSCMISGAVCTVAQKSREEHVRESAYDYARSPDSSNYELLLSASVH